MSIVIPQGFRLAGVHCGIKTDPGHEDLTLAVSSVPAVTAGVYTQNVVCAAPVVLDRQRTPSATMRAVVVNSGNANACTGDRGWDDACQMAQITANACGVQPDQVLVMSTGIIGEHLPMEKIESGILDASRQLGNDDDALVAAARGMLTTDTVHKIAAAEVNIGENVVNLLGLAKGSGMIGPNMATMLALILTDATLDQGDVQRILQEAVTDTFNCISVDGHTSTNDTTLLVASGASGGEPLKGQNLSQFSGAMAGICADLARQIAADGEGASHLITIQVSRCASREDARQIAKSIANSPLVKTAIAGGDPNWGRIVSAAGYSGVVFDPNMVDLSINGTLIYQQGRPVEFDAAALANSIATEYETRIQIQFAEGSHGARFWTCDLTKQYVQINADYHT